jgi:hypothetical protein
VNSRLEQSTQLDGLVSKSSAKLVVRPVFNKHDRPTYHPMSKIPPNVLSRLAHSHRADGNPPPFHFLFHLTHEIGFRRSRLRIKTILNTCFAPLQHNTTPAQPTPCTKPPPEDPFSHRANTPVLHTTRHVSFTTTEYSIKTIPGEIFPPGI